uniref:Uncharacterized protein n=1 Tax=Tanacetum cinerariifolium TaxID=118510 RepID=A0A6L2KBQ1_TANCI|nr:hypothetical protein [Tanacetum cinerariifolium]
MISGSGSGSGLVVGFHNLTYVPSGTHYITYQKKEIVARKKLSFVRMVSKALGGNTRELDSIWKETGQDCNFTRSGFKDARTVPGDGVAIPSDTVRTYKRRRQELCDGVRT